MAKKLNIKAFMDFIRGGRVGFLLLLSLLLAFFIWLLHNLSQDYSVFLNYDVKVITNIEGKNPQSISKDILILRGRANGFYILHHKYFDREELELNVDAKFFNISDTSSENHYNLKVADIKDKIIRKLGNNVNVEFITTNELNFVFANVSIVKLPVVLNTNLEYRPQYINFSAPIVKPDSVVAYGNESLLQNLKNIYTEMLTLDDIHKNEQGIVKLICPKGVKLLEQNAYYAIDVERYIEKSILLPVTVKNAPLDRKLVVIPAYVLYTYRQNYFTQRDYTSDDFECVIDYEDYQESISPKLIPEIHTELSGIYPVKLDPVYVECTLLENQ